MTCGGSEIVCDDKEIDLDAYAKPFDTPEIGISYNEIERASKGIGLDASVTFPVPYTG